MCGRVGATYIHKIYIMNYCISSFSHFLNYLRHAVFRIHPLTRGCPIYLCHFLNVIHLFADNSPPAPLLSIPFSLSFYTGKKACCLSFFCCGSALHGFQCGSGSQQFRSLRIQTHGFDDQKW